MLKLKYFCQFRCNNGDCIPGHLQCSGQPECKDGSDEKNCRKFKKNYFQFNNVSSSFKNFQVKQKNLLF